METIIAIVITIMKWLFSSGDSSSIVMLQSGTWEEFSSRICAQLKPMLPPPANHKLTELKTDVEGGNASVEPRTDVKKRLKTFA